jgi:hypothetical protein
VLQCLTKRIATPLLSLMFVSRCPGSVLLAQPHDKSDRRQPCRRIELEETRFRIPRKPGALQIAGWVRSDEVNLHFLGGANDRCTLEHRFQILTRDTLRGSLSGSSFCKALPDYQNQVLSDGMVGCRDEGLQLAKDATTSSITQSRDRKIIARSTTAIFVEPEDPYVRSRPV